MRKASNPILSRLLRSFLLIVVLVLSNWIVHQHYFRLDLTADQRNSVHPITKNQVKSFEEQIHVTVYLTGELPANFQQLQKATQFLLHTLQAYAPDKIDYQFVDPSTFSPKKKRSFYKKMQRKGIQPTSLFIEDKGKRTEKLIFPGMVIRYQKKQVGVMLLKSSQYSLMPPDAILNQSIENLEFSFLQALRKLKTPIKRKIALLRGHGEPPTIKLVGMMKALHPYYEVSLVPFNAENTSLADYEAVFVTKPTTQFSEAEKFLLDQYIMQGGKVLFFLDRLRIDMNHLQAGKDFAFPLPLELDDLLFRYGVRINQDLIQDFHAGVYPVVVGKMGNQPKIKLMPWNFFPIVNQYSDHLAVKNMGALYLEFTSSMDAVRVKGVRQTPLVFTSKYSKKLSTPVRVDLEDLRKGSHQSTYNQGPQPVVYLLEGKFPSRYKNRFLPPGFEKTSLIEESKPTQIVVASCGSLVLNSTNRKTKKALPWGYDPFLKHTFANEDFLLSILAYMFDDDGLAGVKNKNVQLRPLDKVKMGNERLFWQLLNLLLPLLLLILGGIIRHSFYKKKYGYQA